MCLFIENIYSKQWDIVERHMVFCLSRCWNFMDWGGECWVDTLPVDMGLPPWLESLPMSPESLGTIHSMHGQSRPTKQAWDGHGERIAFSPLAGPSRSGCKHAGRVLWAGLHCSRRHRTRSVDRRKTPVQSPEMAGPAPGWATPVSNILGDFRLALVSWLVQPGTDKPSVCWNSKHITIVDAVNCNWKGIHCHSHSGFMEDFHIHHVHFCKTSLMQNPRDKGSPLQREADMDPHSHQEIDIRTCPGFLKFLLLFCSL